MRTAHAPPKGTGPRSRRGASVAGALRDPALLSIIYAAIGVAWILGTDRVVGALFPARAAELQTLKGLVFVGGTALVMYGGLQLFRHQENRAWRARAATERWYRALIEDSASIVWVLDSAGRILYASPEFGRIFGPPGLDVEDSESLDWIEPADRATARAALLEAPPRPREPSSVVEVQLRDPGGETHLLHARATDLRDDPAVAGIVVHLVDLTQHRRMERQVLQSQKMEIMGRLAGGIAHDFNNILTVLTGYVDLVLGRMDAQDPGHGDVVEIQRATRRAADLARRLLAFSRSRESVPRRLDVNAVVVELRPMLQRLTPDAIVMETHLEREIQPVLADSGELEQVLLNLVVNARDAMPAGGTILIETEAIALRSARAVNGGVLPPGDYALLRVVDTGSGMDEETLRRAFEPFFTTKAPDEGTGLGLSTVRGIVEQRGGMVHLDSAPGLGARVEIWLPIATRPEGVEA